MPTITVSKEGLFRRIGKRLRDEELRERLAMLGTSPESVEGDEVTVEVFPNRPDLLSQQGLARALASFLGERKGLARYEVRPSGERVIIEESVSSCRPFTACAIIKGLRITEERLREIITIQEKLHVTFGRNRKRAAIGIYPMEHVTFPITFKGLRPSEIRFRPLDSPREMSAAEILAEHPKGREYAHLLKGLKRYACFLDAKGNVMSLTPIINSELTGKISERTREVFVECSGFDERVLNECLNIIVTALAEMGGALYSLELHYPGRRVVTPDLSPRRLKLEHEYVAGLLGLPLAREEVVSLLERMGFGYEKGEVLVPAYRTDILHQADLAEDVAIAYGYDRVPEELPPIATIAEESLLERFAQKLRERLVGHGLFEAINYHLISEERQAAMMGLGERPVMIRSPVSREYDSLRSWLLPSLLETLQRNKRHPQPQGFFEVGRSFRRGESETGVVEHVHLCVVLSGEDADYTAIRQVCDDLGVALGTPFSYEEEEHPSFIAGRIAGASARGGRVAFLGEVHPRVLENFSLEAPVAALELDLSLLLPLVKDGE